jgi:hypothetical protein
MEEDEITLFNSCTDLVSLKKCEAFPLRLLDGKRPGEWIRVREFCLQVGVAAGEFNPELFAAWLADPMGSTAYVVILFYDDESKWSMTAQYNRRRLLGDAAPDQTPQPIRAASAVSSGSPSQEATPTAGL